MSGAVLRKRVHDALARGDVRGGEALAREISDPWYRCQSLASVAAQEPSPTHRTKLLDQAFAAADETPSPNRIVTASSWPLRVLDRDGDAQRIAREVSRLIRLAKTEPHPVRRMDALSALQGAVSTEPSASELEREVLAAALAAHGWKRDALIAGRALEAGLAGDSARALTLLGAIELPRAKRVAARNLAEHGIDVPGLALENLEGRRRAVRELLEVRAAAAAAYADWGAHADPNRDEALKERLRGLGERARAARERLRVARASGARTRTR